MALKKITQSQLLITVCITLLSTFIVSCGSGSQQSDQAANRRVEWVQIGIGGGGAQFNPAVSPHDSKMAFVTCDMGASYVTYDGGDSWRMFNLGSMSRYFVFDPVDPNVVYAHSSALFKSEDKGVTWRLFYPPASEVVSKVSKGDHAGVVWYTKDTMRQSVQALAIDPTQSKNLYAAITKDQSTALYSSVNGGAVWKKEKDFDHAILSIYVDPSSPAEQRTLYIGWSYGIYQRVNGQWQSFGVPDKDVKFNSFSGGYDTELKKYILYGISGRSYYNTENTYSGIYYSENGGKTWENRQGGLLTYCPPDRKRADFNAIEASANHPSILYVSYSGLPIHADTTCLGVAKSVDYGKTWTLAWQDKTTRTGGDPISTPNYAGCWLSNNLGVTWGGRTLSLGVGPNDPDVCYRSDMGRTIKTRNGGKSWEPAYTKQLPDGSWTTRGIEVTTGYDVIFDPFDDNHMFVSLTDIGLQESKNGGKGWITASALNNGVPRNWRNTTYWVAMDPEVRGRIWAVMARNHDLPRPKMFRNGGVDRYEGGITYSSDGGASWDNVSGASFGEAAMTHILLDPKSNKDSRTLYACAYGKGVYKSTDGGLNWVLKNNGIEGDEPFAFRIERRESDGALFLIVSRRSEDGRIGDDWDGALYKSTDGAESWAKMTLPAECNGPTDILTTKKYPKRLVLSAWGRATRGKYTSDIGGGIFISDDEGKTWTQVMDKDQHIYAVSFDPRKGRYYACGFNASAYYSEDGAKTWTRIRGYNFKWGHRVVPDPRDPNMIFVCTFGGGVWHGPATGDPESTEDVLDLFETR